MLLDDRITKAFPTSESGGRRQGTTRTQGFIRAAQWRLTPRLSNSARQIPQEPRPQRDRHLPAVARCGDGASAHRAHPLADSVAESGAPHSASAPLRGNGRESVPVSAMRRLASYPPSKDARTATPASENPSRRARLAEAAAADLPLRRDSYGSDQFVGGQRQVRGAVVGAKLGLRHRQAGRGGRSRRRGQSSPTPGRS